jgi:hypothetical protein
MVGRAVSGDMVFTPEPGIAKTIVSAAGVAFALRIACRSEPAPESPVLSTVSVAARAVALADRRNDDADLLLHSRWNVFVMKTAIWPRVLLDSGQ